MTHNYESIFIINYLRYKLTILFSAVAVSSLLLSACAAPRKAVVVERQTIPERVETDRIGGRLIRHVQPGDTLYSIAFAHNVNPNDVADWNGVDDSRKIRVGQRLRLTKPIGFREKKPVESVLVKPSPVAGKPNVVTRRSNTNTRQAPATKATSALQWQWPTNGRVISRFSLPQGQQGIDIQAPQGQAVQATAAGDVVYVGNGLQGYGNLVILKHSDRFLSAYAHNQEIYVREGDKVTARQKIGSVGVNRQGVTALQFQIRQYGKPVNPLNYLKSG